MKRNLLIILTSVLVIMILNPAKLNAQEGKESKIEKKVEKKIKIVTVDESGEKTVIDTIIRDVSDPEIIHIGKGAVWIMDTDIDHKSFKTKEGEYIVISDDKDSFSIVTSDEESEGEQIKLKMHIDKNHIYTKDGNVIRKSSGNEDHSYMVITSDDGENNHTWLEKPGKLKDGQAHIVIRTNNEVEDFIIDGDAVITIKDGKVKIDSEGLKMNADKKGDSRVKKEK